MLGRGREGGREVREREKRGEWRGAGRGEGRGSRGGYEVSEREGEEVEAILPSVVPPKMMIQCPRSHSLFGRYWALRRGRAFSSSHKDSGPAS